MVNGVSLRGNGGRGQRRHRLILYSVPFLALALLLGVYYVSTASPQAAEDFTVPIVIEISTMNGGGGSASIQNILPRGVGVAGIIWNSHQYDSDGMNGRYPLFGAGAPNGNTNYSLIHVRSRVARTYTLLDFFNVWGFALGPSNTLGYTVPPQASQNNLYGSDWFWQMCVSVGSGAFQQRDGATWGSETLVPNKRIILIYSNYGCLQSL